MIFLIALSLRLNCNAVFYLKACVKLSAVNVLITSISFVEYCNIIALCCNVGI